MAEWIYEAGIGEARAALVEANEIIEACIEPDDIGLRAGAVCSARLLDILNPSRRGVVQCPQGAALLEPLPPALTQGGQLTVEIMREAIPEPGAKKRAKARLAPPDAAIVPGGNLLARITNTGIAVRQISLHDADALERAGWSECLEDAAAGIARFKGGTLRISLTPAMTLIDVDGYLPPHTLALSAAHAAGAAIRRFNIAGSIGIDFPTLANKAVRLATAGAFDAALPPPFERTAINGFGFLQIIRPRLRASLCEHLQYDGAAAAARALLRSAQHSGIIGSALLSAHPEVIAIIRHRPDWLDQLGTELGGNISLRNDASLGIGSGHVVKA